jgi:VWFA-related protein
VRRVLALCIALVLLAPATALAATQVREVDTGEYPTIRLTAVAGAASSSPPKLTENGGAVAGLRASNLGDSKSVFLAVDRSRSMQGQAILDAVAAARAFVAGKPASDRLAVATFGSEAVALTGFSTSTIDADSALGALSIDPISGTELYDVIVLGAKALAAEQNPSRVLIVLTDGADFGSDAVLADAITAAQDAGVAVYAIAITSGGFSPGPIRELARETGGSYYGTPSTEALTQVYTAIGEELRRTWLMEYTTRARPGETLALEVTAAGESATAEVKAPGIPAPTVEAPKRSPLLPDIFYKSAWGSQLLAATVGARRIPSGSRSQARSSRRPSTHSRSSGSGSGSNGPSSARTSR